MSRTQNSALVIVLAVIGICTIHFLSKWTGLDRGTKLRLILRRVSLILLLASGITAIEARAGTVLERTSDTAMLVFVVLYLVFPLYGLGRLVLNGVRTKSAQRPGAQ